VILGAIVGELILKSMSAESVTATELMEEAIETNKKALLADDLMQRLIKAQEWDRAKKLAWFMYFEYSVDSYLADNK